MSKIATVCLVLLVSVNSLAQKNDSTATGYCCPDSPPPSFLLSENSKKYDENFIYNKVEIEARYQWGKDSLHKFVINKLEYPARALEKRIQGRVLVKFVVEKDGTISNINSLNDIGGGCREEAIRLIKLTSGDWEPAKENGEKVRSYYRVPISFNLLDRSK